MTALEPFTAAFLDFASFFEETDFFSLFAIVFSDFVIQDLQEMLSGGREEEGEMGEGGRGESEMKPKIAQLLAEKFSIC